jgi:integrase
MSVFLNKDSRYYQFDFQIDGHRVSGSTKCVDKEKAKAYEAERRVETEQLIERIRATDTAPLTIRRACDRWWDEHGSKLRDPDLQERLVWLWQQLGENTPLHAITNDMLSNLVARRRCDLIKAGREPTAKTKGKRQAKGAQLYRLITARTVNKTTVSLLRRVLRRARDNWDATIIREPSWSKHLLREKKRPVREISPVEETRLDDEEGVDYALMRKFAIITGLRRGNLILTWSQVDFDAGVVRVIAKGGVPRVLPLTREAYAILWSRRGHHPVFVFTFVAQKTRLCPKSRDPQTGERMKFIKGTRYPVTYYGLGSAKRYAWARAGVDARIHDLRHTTGMRTLRATGNLRVVQGILGHSDIAITAKFYTDALVDDMRAAMETTAAASPLALPAPKSATTGENDQ